MLINADHPEECRAVVLENGIIEDLIVEHSSHEKIKGNIYLGVINRVEPAIEAAFVDIGGKKFGFLPFKDVRRESYLNTGEKKARVRIQDVLVRGQIILVQVAKEGRDMKGPSLTNEISLPGRFLVLMIGQQATAISRKIEDETERKKLREIITGFNLPENMGVIIRTAGVGRTKIELQKDMQTLVKIWENIDETISNPETNGPSLAYREPSQVVRVLRDHFTADTSQIIVDNKEAYKELKDFVKLVMPRMHRRIRMHDETQPLFSQYKVEEQIESIYNRRVELPSGGSIVFDSGEAMVSIDVNSGKTTSASQLEETATNTNLEAASEIGRQLRLRDLGGLVVIDFIDMFQKKNKSQVERQMKAATKLDKARINISRISKFGLLEMSRQRISPPVKEGVFENCATCEGSGHVKSVGSMALLVMRKLRESIAGGGVNRIQGTISTVVLEYLLNNKMEYLQKLQADQNVKVVFKGQAGLKPADFTFVVLERHKVEDNKEQDKEAVVDTKPRSNTRTRSNSRSRSNSMSRNNRSRNNTRTNEASEKVIGNEEQADEKKTLEVNKDEVSKDIQVNEEVSSGVETISEVSKDAINKEAQNEKPKGRTRSQRPRNTQRKRYPRKSGGSRSGAPQGRVEQSSTENKPAVISVKAVALQPEADVSTESKQAPAAKVAKTVSKPRKTSTRTKARNPRRKMPASDKKDSTQELSADIATTVGADSQKPSPAVVVEKVVRRKRPVDTDNISPSATNED